jgi:hypothetical protein
VRSLRIRNRAAVVTLVFAALVLNALFLSSRLAVAQEATSDQTLSDAPVAKKQDQNGAEQRAQGGWRRHVAILLGGLASEGLANSYLRDNERTTGRTFSRFGVRVGWGALGI